MAASENMPLQHLLTGGIILLIQCHFMFRFLTTLDYPGAAQDILGKWRSAPSIIDYEEIRTNLKQIIFENKGILTLNNAFNEGV